ncbi:SulP family inorganic anion transporter [Corynebacterium diphtheriae]|nr:SulP family inorganic anion transporter [Corynebacterium diphtheriae]
MGLFTSVIMPLVIALTGGRPAMITATVGSVALVLRCGSRGSMVRALIVSTTSAVGFNLVGLGVARLGQHLRDLP